MFGERLKELRQQKNMTRREVANRLELTPKAVSLDYLFGIDKGEGEMNENVFEAIWNLQRRATERENQDNGEGKYGIVYGDYTEDELLQQIKYQQEALAELNREIRAGLDAAKARIELKRRIKETMTQFIKEC